MVQASFLLGCSPWCLILITWFTRCSHAVCRRVFWCFIIVFVIDFGGTWGLIQRRAARVYVCVCVHKALHKYPYVGFVQVHICVSVFVLVTHLSFRDTVSFHFNAWLVNNCLCGRYDVLSSRRAFSACLVCVYEHVCVLFWCAPRHVFFFFLSEEYIHVVYRVHTHTHLEAYKSQFLPLSSRLIWLEHTRLIRRRWTDPTCHLTTCTLHIAHNTQRERGGGSKTAKLRLIQHLW